MSLNPMNPSIAFNQCLIAPCGMNCGTCIAFLRDKNKCYGCRTSTSNLKTRIKCIIKNCDRLAGTNTNFCYDCEVFPCKRLIQLDKRYRTKYKTGLISNLLIIKESGIISFLETETKRRTCPGCGSILSVHRMSCLKCSYDW